MLDALAPAPRWAPARPVPERPTAIAATCPRSYPQPESQQPPRASSSSGLGGGFVAAGRWVPHEGYRAATLGRDIKNKSRPSGRLLLTLAGRRGGCFLAIQGEPACQRRRLHR